MVGMRIEIPGARSPEGGAIRNFRVQAGMTQKQLAATSGVSTGALGMIESGHWRPSPRVIRVLSAALPLTLSEEQAILTLREQEWDRRTSIMEAEHRTQRVIDPLKVTEHLETMGQLKIVELLGLINA